VLCHMHWVAARCDSGGGGVLSLAAVVVPHLRWCRWGGLLLVPHPWWWWCWRIVPVVVVRVGGVGAATGVHTVARRDLWGLVIYKIFTRGRGYIPSSSSLSRCLVT
jgi:hypothetical protein